MQTDPNTCACCGQPVADDVELCLACESQLDLRPTEPINSNEEVEQGKKLRTDLVDLAEVPSAFTIDNGFSYPDWEVVRDPPCQAHDSAQGVASDRKGERYSLSTQRGVINSHHHFDSPSPVAAAALGFAVLSDGIEPVAHRAGVMRKR